MKKRENIIWFSILLIGVVLMLVRLTILPDGMGKAYVKTTPVVVDGGNPEGQWLKIDGATKSQFDRAQLIDPNQKQYHFSLSRTVGIWIAALFTLGIFSFLYKDNPFYKMAEAILVGVSAAYWMVVGFWEVIVPNLVARLAPKMTMAWAMPGLEGRDTEPQYRYFIPLVLGIMLLWRLSPKGAWIGRWPLAFIIGTTAGIRLVGFTQADFLSQIRATIIPLVEQSDTGKNWTQSIANVNVVVGV
jgi:hypothetical protein